MASITTSAAFRQSCMPACRHCQLAERPWHLRTGYVYHPPVTVFLHGYDDHLRRNLLGSPHSLVSLCMGVSPAARCEVGPAAAIGGGAYADAERWLLRCCRRRSLACTTCTRGGRRDA